MKNHVGLGLLVLVVSANAFAADRPADRPSSSTAQSQAGPKVDNSRVNARDKDGATQTPEDQAKGSEADRRLVAAVRKAVESDKSLSTSARNVKIVTKDGVVTLRGPVNSAEEKSKVGQLAQQVAGVSSVQNQIDVKTR
jgi:osmotically-inducible protein OsmY